MAAGNTCGFFIYAFCLHILFSVNHCVIVNYKKSVSAQWTWKPLLQCVECSFTL